VIGLVGKDNRVVYVIYYKCLDYEHMIPTPVSIIILCKLNHPLQLTIRNTPSPMMGIQISCQLVLYCH
jgi:hypothetical protein